LAEHKKEWQMTDRFDLLLVCEKPGQRLAPKAGEAFMRNLATIRIAQPVDESIAKDWVEVYCDAGPSAHELFIKGAYESPEPVFQKMVVRFGTQAVDTPFGREGQETFYVEIRGALYDTMLGLIRTRFQDITHFRPAVLVRPSEGTWEKRDVPEGEEAVARKRAEIGSAKAGTRVEEF
jgi:hypothetical protein